MHLLQSTNSLPHSFIHYHFFYIFIQVDFSEVVEATFSFNEAQFTGGAIYADAASTTVTADLYNHTLAGGVVGFCFIQFPNKLIIAEVRGRTIYVELTVSH